jgi:hypothetical protein
MNAEMERDNSASLISALESARAALFPLPGGAVVADPDVAAAVKDLRRTLASRLPKTAAPDKVTEARAKALHVAIGAAIRFLKQDVAETSFRASRGGSRYRDSAHAAMLAKRAGNKRMRLDSWKAVLARNLAFGMDSARVSPTGVYRNILTDFGVLVELCGGCAGDGFGKVGRKAAEEVTQLRVFARKVQVYKVPLTLWLQLAANSGEGHAPRDYRPDP